MTQPVILTNVIADYTPDDMAWLCDAIAYRRAHGKWPPIPADAPVPPEPVPSPVAVRWVQVKDPAAKVNVRSAPTIPVVKDLNVIGSMTGIMKYAVLGESLDWWKISYNLKEGWVSKAWTRLE